MVPMKDISNLGLVLRNSDQAIASGWLLMFAFWPGVAQSSEQLAAQGARPNT